MAEQLGVLLLLVVILTAEYYPTACMSKRTCAEVVCYSIIQCTYMYMCLQPLPSSLQGEDQFFKSVSPVLCHHQTLVFSCNNAVAAMDEACMLLPGTYLLSVWYLKQTVMNLIQPNFRNL